MFSWWNDSPPCVTTTSTNFQVWEIDYCCTLLDIKKKNMKWKSCDLGLFYRVCVLYTVLNVVVLWIWQMYTLTQGSPRRRWGSVYTWCHQTWVKLVFASIIILVFVWICLECQVGGWGLAVKRTIQTVTGQVVNHRKVQKWLSNRLKFPAVVWKNPTPPAFQVGSNTCYEFFCFVLQILFILCLDVEKLWKKNVSLFTCTLISHYCLC